MRRSARVIAALLLPTLLLACVAVSSAMPGAVRAADAAAPDAFRALCARLEAGATQAGAMTVPGSDGWLFFANELHYAAAGEFWGEVALKASRASRPEHADPLPAIVDFKRQLDALGIGLLLVPVPPKIYVYPDKLAPDTPPAPGLDSAQRAFYEVLRGQGVDVLDLTTRFVAGRSAGEGSPFCMQDTHWSGEGCVWAAREIARVLSGRPAFAGVQALVLAEETRAVEIQGDLRAALPGERPPPETLKLRFVGTGAPGALVPVAPSPSSPVLLLGDSHNLVFHGGGDMHASGAGLPDQLAWELKFAPDLIAVRGSGATPARVSLLRKARATPGYLAGKKLVIWCFGAREFTESRGWQLVPIAP